MISVPLQYNYDQQYGSDAHRPQVLLNVQPVVPSQISPEWNVISRTIVPLINQSGVSPASTSRAWATSRRAYSSRPGRPARAA